MVAHTERPVALLKLLSVLLQYPDEEYADSLATLKETVENEVEASAGRKLGGFLAAVEAIPSIDLQEHFTQIFDISPATSLNLTYHSLEDSEDRGRTLADMDQVYCRAGFARATTELPDYLPLVLEFLSQSPRADGSELLWQMLTAVDGIAERLRKIDSPYRIPIALLAEVVHAEIPPAGDDGRASHAADPPEG